jgi:anti-anti-sigma factor
MVTLSITARHPTERSTVLALRGVVDYRSAADLRTAISAAAGRRPAPDRIVVDLRRVESIDKAGVGVLVVGSRICRDMGIDLAVRNPSPLLRRVGRRGFS